MLGPALKAAGVVSTWVRPLSKLIALIVLRRWKEVQAQAILLANQAEKEAFQREMGVRE